jgi:hypothetical protein
MFFDFGFRNFDFGFEEVNIWKIQYQSAFEIPNSAFKVIPHSISYVADRTAHLKNSEIEHPISEIILFKCFFPCNI